MARADAGAASGLMNTAKQAGAGLGLLPALPSTAPSPAGYAHAFLAIATTLAVASSVALALPRG
jgi:hypothetical protein